MIRFDCDYLEGAHPAILDALARENFRQHMGYSDDPISADARDRIRAAFSCPDAAVEFAPGGTLCNTVVISAALRPHQGVITADSGHIARHESGAIESSGHKVLTVPTRDGKLAARDVRLMCEERRNDPAYEHIVEPGMVYLSQPTECGTLYSKRELTEISAVARALGIPLYIDGARLGYGLASPENDLEMADIARLADAFCIGGTKVGMLFGEALVIPNRDLQRDIRCILKQRGGLTAKGWLMGLQFLTMFEDDRYMQGARHAIAQAMRIRDAFVAHGVPMPFPSPTNQQFVALTREQAAALDREFGSEFWSPLPDGGKVVRFCTSWATRTEDVDALIAAIAALFPARPCGA